MEQAVRTSEAKPLRVFLNPIAMLRGLLAQRELIWQLAKRDIEGRYRAARLGLLWAVLTPLCLLGIYTFVFAVVFRFRWTDNPNETRGQFALTMFCGMLLYGLFAEVANRAPQMVVANPNYVKKVVFPLEVFVVSGLLSALINMLIGYGVWLVGWLLIEHRMPPWTLVWMPVVLLPVCLTTAGVSWFLASIGVFIRDVGHALPARAGDQSAHPRGGGHPAGDDVGRIGAGAAPGVDVVARDDSRLSGRRPAGLRVLHEKQAGVRGYHLNPGERADIPAGPAAGKKTLTPWLQLACPATTAAGFGQP
jgi:ABC-type polysaccharide/polyol phosphate export permease